jgi:hypothetical protein
MDLMGCLGEFQANPDQIPETDQLRSPFPLDGVDELIDWSSGNCQRHDETSQVGTVEDEVDWQRYVTLEIRLRPGKCDQCPEFSFDVLPLGCSVQLDDSICDTLDPMDGSLAARSDAFSSLDQESIGQPKAYGAKIRAAMMMDLSSSVRALTCS